MYLIEELTRKHLLSFLCCDYKSLPIEAVIFGTGQICDDFLELYRDNIKVKKFFDNHNAKNSKFGASIVRPTYHREIDQCCSIFIASSDHDSIANQLQQLGYGHPHHRINAQILINPITPFLLKMSRELFLFIISELKKARGKFAVLKSVLQKNSSPAFEGVQFHLFADSSVVHILEENRERIDWSQDEPPVYVVAIHCLRGDYETRIVNLFPDLLIQRLIDSSRRDRLYHNKIDALAFDRLGPIFFNKQSKDLSGSTDYRSFFFETDPTVFQNRSDLTRSSWVSLELSRAYERQMYFLGFDTTVMRKQLLHDLNSVEFELIFVILRDSCSDRGLADNIKSFFVAKGLVFGCHISLSRREKILLRAICRGGNWEGSAQEKLSGYPDEILVLIDENPPKLKVFFGRTITPVLQKKFNIKF